MEDLREQLELAFKEEEEPANESPPEEEDREEAKAEVPGDTEASGEAGEGEGSDGEPAQASAEDGEAKPAGGASAGPKPPIDWDAGLREQWDGLPANVREKIAAREQHISQTIQGTGEARRLAQEFQQLSTTYGSVFAAEGVTNPMEAINGLMQTASQLRLGSATDKAAKIAELIQHYGVDIATLDSMLVGDEGVQQTSQMEQMIDQRMAPVNEMMNNLAQLQQGKQQNFQQSVQDEIAEFERDAEFINDVRSDMAYFLNMATQQGHKMTLRQAYDKACSVNETVQGVMNQRKQAALATKKQAASSIPAGGRGNEGQAPNMNLHDELLAAWDSASG